MNDPNTTKSGIARLIEIAGSRKRLLILSTLLAMMHVLLSIVPYLLIYSIIKTMMVQPIDVQLIQGEVQLAI